MTIRHTLAAAVAATILVITAGCAVQRGQETTGAYIDDAAITTQIKGRMTENQTVDASSISVETLNGTVMLSGFAKNANEMAMAETLTRGVNGVRSVKNQIVIRP